MYRVHELIEFAIGNNYVGYSETGDGTLNKAVRTS